MPEDEGKIVVLFGYYKYGNFGDDLMAVIFALALREAGYRARIFGLLPAVADEFGLETCSDLDEAVSGAHAVVYGGGGAFIGIKEATANHDEFEADIVTLCDALDRHKVPLFMFSVGGDNSPVEEISPGRLRLLQSSRFVTFRNPEETTLFKMAKCWEVFPDIVWSTASRFKALRQSAQACSIGIDRSISYQFLPKLLRKTFRMLQRLAPRRVALYEFQQRVVPDLPPTPGAYKTIGHFVSDIASMDAIVTSRLHLGMTAMSLGIPAIQVDSRPKARLLFRRLGFNHLTVESATDVFTFAYRAALNRQWFTAALDPQKLALLQQQCLGHIKRMLVCLNECSTSRRETSSFEPDVR